MYENLEERKKGTLGRIKNNNYEKENQVIVLVIIY